MREGRLQPGINLRGAIVSGVAWGSLAALGQCAKVFRRYYLNGELAWTSRDFYWMSPLANALYFVVVAVILWVAVRALKGKVSEPLVGAVLAGLCTFAVLLPFGGINQYAVLLLAIGVGVQYARLLRGGSPRLRRLIHGGGIAAGTLLLVGGATERATREGRNAPPRGPSPGAEAPNVLVIIWDTVRAANLSLYGYARETTPQLQKLAASSMTFDWAISPAPWTLPSHCSMFTGLHPGEHSCRWDDPLGRHAATVAEVFTRNGYRTGGFVANRFYASHETGLHRGFEVYEDFSVSLQQVLLSSSLAQMAIVRDALGDDGVNDRTRALRRFQLRGSPKPLVHRKVAATITDDFLRWEEQRDAPWFAFLNYFDAHDPYDPPPPWKTRFSADPDRMASYDGGIAYMDAELGRLVQVLTERGVLDRTIVVLTSDHGEMFGEHGGIVSHGNALYLELTRVPLVMRYPRALPAGIRVSRPVPLRDLARTLVELAGLPDTMPGQSFGTAEWRSAPVPEGAPRRDRVALSETEKTKQFWTKGPAAEGALHALTDDTHHYILYPGNREELFAYRSDPGEATNLATTPKGGALAATYRELLPTIPRRLLK
jgi:arylsulfatase A-like enzyme